VAPETLEGRLRNLINKGELKDEHVFKSVDLATKYHIPNFGLYLMMGLPTERSDDIKNLAILVKNVRERMNMNGNKKGILEVHINPLFPKPFTPLQWMKMENTDITENKLKIFKDTITRNYKIFEEKVGKVIVGAGYLPKIPNEENLIVIRTLIGTKTLFTQPVLARGDQRIGKVLYFAYKDGNTLQAWKSAFNKAKIDSDFFFKEIPLNAKLPWQIIDTGVNNKYLKNEWKNAFKYVLTSGCGNEFCKKCGVCS